MNLFRPQKPYEFCPPKYARWFQPVLHLVSAWILKRRFNIRRIIVRGEEPLVRLVRDRQSVLVTPNHADHADPSLLVQVGRRNGFAFHFMAAREGFEHSKLKSCSAIRWTCGNSCGLRTWMPKPACGR